MLLAVRDAGAKLPLSQPYTGDRIFRMVSPTPSALTVELVDGAVARFIRALLPSQEPDDRGFGVPGIRFVPKTNYMSIHLLGEDDRLTDACVILRNVTAWRWPDIWSEVNNIDDEYRCIDPVWTHSPSLNGGERSRYRGYWQLAGPVGLGSAMLRRCGLLTGAFALDVWTGDGGTVLNVETDDGPSVYDVLAALRHPVAGIVDGQFAADTSRGPIEPNMKYARILDTAPTPATFIGQRRLLRKGVPALALRGCARPEHRFPLPVVDRSKVDGR